MFIHYLTEVCQHKYPAEQEIKDKNDKVVRIHAIKAYRGSRERELH
jgi:hypothetical protein